MEFKKLGVLIARNNKLYFKDKMQFFLSLITPMILIVLFLTFIGNVYKDSLQQITSAFGAELESGITNVFVSSWLFSSILSTSCITVAFCSNVLINDKISKANQDFKIAPVKKSTLQVSYLVSNFLSTLIVCGIAFLVSIIYFIIAGWYFSFTDIVLLITNILLTSFLGSLAASIVWQFVSSQGAQSAVCTLVSSMYGFICGAYMPISQFSPVIRNIVSFIPGTYSTVIFRHFYTHGILDSITNLPPEAINEIKNSFDATFSFFNNQVSILAMFIIEIVTIAILFGIYLLVVNFKHFKKHKKQNTLNAA